MSETFDLNEITAHSEAANEDGEDFGTAQKGLDDQKAALHESVLNSTYLDEAEAESFDREMVEGWRETAGVYVCHVLSPCSVVITVSISQALQRLQDNALFSGLPSFEAFERGRANFTGVPASDIPVPTLTPTSSFMASINTWLVNHPWFTSLIITFFVALFAMLVKQWLYHYPSPIPETANEKARARQLRFNGVESWKVGAMVGMFLTGIIALWCAAVHPNIRERFYWRAVRDPFPALEVGKTNAMDIRHGPSFGLPTHEYVHWELLPYISDVVESQLGEGEYQTYLRVAETVLQFKEERRTLLDAINGDSSLPLAMWCYLLKKTSTDATVAVHILAHGTRSLFDWKFDPTRELIHNAGLVRFDSEELGWWKFEHLFHYFALGKPDCSSESETYKTGYLLLIAIYRNLTSDDPLITDKEQRQESLGNGFFSFRLCFGRPHRLEDALRFFTEICCVDLFWCESMTDHARFWAVDTLYGMNFSITDLDNCLSFMDLHNLSLIYQWYSQGLHSNFSQTTPPLFVLLLVSQNHHHLSTILLNDPDPVSHFSKCLHNLANYSNIEEEISLYLILDLLKSVNPENPLFTILHDPSVLVQLWRLLVYHKSETERYFLLVKSKIDREKSDMLFAAMNELVRSSENLDNLPYRCRWDSEYKDYILSALPASAREFGQLIGVFHTQHEATADKSAPENSASDKDQDIEERAQVSERQNHHSVADSIIQ